MCGMCGGPSPLPSGYQGIWGADEVERQLPQAFGIVGIECIGGDPEAAAACGARLDDRRYLAIREVSASDAL